MPAHPLLQLRPQTHARACRWTALEAVSAVHEVDCESVSQFNREYSRFFGQPPMRDIKALRDNKIVSITTA